MGKTASQASDTYKREVVAYVTEVMEQTRWSISELARNTGVDRSTLSRAVNGKKATQYPALLQVARKTGIYIPKRLEDAAAGLKDVGRDAAPADVAETYRKALAELRNRPDFDEETFRRVARELIDVSAEAKPIKQKQRT